MTKHTLDSQQMADLATGLNCAVRWYAEAVAVYADANEDPSQLRLGWQGRTVALHLLRSVNSSGVLSDLGTEPELILAELLRLPLEVVTPGLSALVRTGTVTLGGGILVWTAFVDAQRSRKSETQRKAEYRAKRTRLK